MDSKFITVGKQTLSHIWGVTMRIVTEHGICTTTENGVSSGLILPYRSSLYAARLTANSI